MCALTCVSKCVRLECRSSGHACRCASNSKVFTLPVLSRAHARAGIGRVCSTARYWPVAITHPLGKQGQHH